MDTRVVYLEPGKINVAEQTLPGLAPNQVLVRTHQASVCGSERYFYRGISVHPEDEARGGSEAVSDSSSSPWCTAADSARSSSPPSPARARGLALARSRASSSYSERSRWSGWSGCRS